MSIPTSTGSRWVVVLGLDVSMEAGVRHDVSVSFTSTSYFLHVISPEIGPSFCVSPCIGLVQRIIVNYLVISISNGGVNRCSYRDSN